MIWRAIQALGGSAGMSVGAAVIGDIYRLEERGAAMGIFFGASLVGPTVSPFCGGLATHYASWRVMQLAIAVAAVLVFVLMLTSLPETAHPGARGVDRDRASARKMTIRNGEVTLEADGPENAMDKGNGWGFKLLNPLGGLWLMRSPNLLFVVCLSFLSSLSYSRSPGHCR
jgi:MFS family permease